MLNNRNIFETAIQLALGLSILMFAACDSEKQEIKFKPNGEGLFEGELVMRQKQGIDEMNITFIISDSIIIREAVTDGFFLEPEETAGMILNLDEETVTLYTSETVPWPQSIMDGEIKGLRSTISFEEYEKLLENYAFDSDELVTPQDYMFSYLEGYDETIGRDNVLPDLKLQLDYHLYHEGGLFQDVFDSPKVNVDSKLLPLIFPEIPTDLNFPLIYRLYRSGKRDADFDASKMSEDEIGELIADGLSSSLETESKLIKLIERAITKEDVFRDVSEFHETDPKNILQKQRYSGGGGGFGFGDD